MATQAEMVEELKGVVTTIKRIGEETVGLQLAVDTLNEKIKELEDLVASGAAISELVDAVNEVKVAANEVDDKVPNVVVPPPPDA